MSAHCVIPSNPDISGIGVRVAIYIQNIMCFVPALWAIIDGNVTEYELDSVETHSTTNLFLAFAILLSCIVQAQGRSGLSNYHGSIILSMSWMNNTNAFIYFLLYVQYKGQEGMELRWKGWMRHVLGRINIVLSPLFWLKSDRSPALHGSKSHHKSWCDACSQALGVLFKRIALVLGSLHLTLMAALGIWLWSSPQSFGTPDSDPKCAIEYAELAIVGGHVPFGSKALRVISLVAYSLILIPGVNLLLPMMAFLALHCWYHRQYPLLPKVAPDANKRARMKQVTPVCVGLIFLFAFNIVFIADIELTLARNGHLQGADESEWGFGQILAMLLVFMPLRDIVEAVFRKRQELQTRLNEALKKAINDRNLHEIMRWVTAGADPNVKGEGGQICLEVASLKKEWNTVGAILGRGADVNALFSDGRTALEVAAVENDWDSVRVLLSKFKADVDKRFSNNQSALEVACLAENRDAVRDILAANADHTVLFSAVDRKFGLEVAFLARRWDTFGAILARGADVDASFPDGRTALEVATAENDWDIVHILLSKFKADVNKRFSNNQTALEVACLAKSRDAVGDILAANADVAMLSSADTKQFCLEVACLNRRWDIVRAILAKGADVHALFSDGRSALEVATDGKDSNGIRVLLSEFDVDVDTQFRNGCTALEVAARAMDWKSARIMLEYGAETTFRDGLTAKEVVGATGDQEGMRLFGVTESDRDSGVTHHSTDASTATWSSGSLHIGLRRLGRWVISHFRVHAEEYPAPFPDHDPGGPSTDGRQELWEVPPCPPSEETSHLAFPRKDSAQSPSRSLCEPDALVLLDNVERIRLVPGWATGRYSKEDREDGSTRPFEVEAFVSGYAVASKNRETTSRSQRAFIRVAKGFAALPKLASDTSLAVAVLEKPAPLSKSTEELLTHIHLPLRPGQVTDAYDTDALDHSFRRTRTSASDASSLSSISLTEDVASALKEAERRIDEMATLPTSTLSTLSTASLRRMHANLETRLEPFWSSVLPNRIVRLKLYAIAHQNTTTPSAEGDLKPLAFMDVTTGIDGSFQGRFVVKWDELCHHPSALHIAFGEHVQEHDLQIRAELLKPQPIPGTTSYAQFQSPWRMQQNVDEVTHSTKVKISITHSPIRVISDIDDTVKQSGVPNGARAVFHNVFVKELNDCIVDGMGEWYNRMWGRGVRFHYVSNGPFELISILDEFFALSKLPVGSVKLRSLVGRSLFSGLLSAPTEEKRAGVEDIIKSFPDSRFFVIGDSGEQDLELYSQVAESYPDNVLGVFIRDVTTIKGVTDPLEDPTGQRALEVQTSVASQYGGDGANFDERVATRMTSVCSTSPSSSGFAPGAMMSQLTLSTSGVSPEEKGRRELQMRMWRARLVMPLHVKLRLFKDPKECEYETDEMLQREFGS